MGRERGKHAHGDGDERGCDESFDAKDSAAEAILAVQGNLRPKWTSPSGPISECMQGGWRVLRHETALRMQS